MMATAGPPSNSSFLPLLESLEDGAAGQSEQTDAYLTIANRLSGEEGRQFLPAVEKHFSRLGKAILAHISSPNTDLCQAALQALGFCVYHSHVVSGVPETFAAEVLSALCSLVVKSTDKNTCTRALWVISKQSFSPDVVTKKVPRILEALESVWSREDVQSVVMEHEALNVVIRLLEHVPKPMGDGTVRWAKLVIPLVVHSASKVRLRAAAAMELGMPLLLEKQTDVAGIIEPIMSSKLIPELQKLFMSKNETNVLKLWPLFVKLLGKLLHKGGPFINSLLHLEELGFRSSSPTIKKIAFLAWKSLIDNFALNPDILCSAKRMKLLMQPLISINVKTEALMLTKVEVWWYLVVQLGANLSPNFDQVSVPLLQCTIAANSSSVPGTPARAVTQNGTSTPGTPKTATAGTSGFNSPANTTRMSLNSSVQVPTTFPSIQVLGLEMLLHYFLGPEVVTTAAKHKVTLSLEPLNHPLLYAASSFTKHAAVLISNIRDGVTSVGQEAPESLLSVLWTNLVRFVSLTIESGGSKKDRQGCEVLTLMLQALQSIVTSEALPADRVLILFEATVKGVPQRVLGSASYQVGKMDVLNGTPALYIVLLLFNSTMLPAYIEDERFFQCLQTLVGCGLSGPTSPLAFGEAVLGAMSNSAASLQNKEQLLRMWSVMVSPLTDTITQSNEVNQGDALEHNFSALHSALLFPVTHLLRGAPLQQASQKSMLSTWSKLYKVFARCSALVVTAEENICCEEFCAKMATAIDKDALMAPSTLNAVASILQVVVECVDFSPYTPHFQQKLKSPHTPLIWTRKRNKALGNLSTFQSLLIQCLDVYLENPEASADPTGLALLSILSALFTNLVLALAVQEALTSLIQPLTVFYKQAATEPPKFTSQILAKLEKLLAEVLGCLQSSSTLACDDELLALLSPLLCVVFPHKNKQVRTSVAHFWNSTFANSVSLAYPDELRPILSQVKQKTPIILPGFEAVSVPDELSGQYSSESSQMETKLSGITVSSVGKRDSLLGKTPELKDRRSAKTSKPVSTKLDFGSPKPPRRQVLEEEASIDFVFIPPETKERVLTEHQKEVKRTKRVDIPAMYNNLDASMDTTVFSQYTQSQEDSAGKLPTEQEDMVAKEAPGKVSQEAVANEEEADVQTKDTQDYVSPTAVENQTENHKEEEMIPESADVSMEDDAKNEVSTEDMDTNAKEGTSPNISGSSDLVSGTPQKPCSRRQSFITLEKYTEGKPASPKSTFTGPLIKTSNSQERSDSLKTSTPQASQTVTGPNSQDCHSSQTGQINSQCLENNLQESPRRPKVDSGKKSKPVRLTDRLPSDATEDEDVIPDTQTEAEVKESTEKSSTLEEMNPSSQEGESQQSLDESQSSETQTSSGEPRRSGRPRVRPLLPGENPEEQEEKYTHSKRRRSGEENKGSTPQQGRPNTRSKQAAEEDSGRRRTRAQSDLNKSSQTNSQGRSSKKIRLFSNSQDFLAIPEHKRRSARDQESSQTDPQSDTQSEHESQSQKKPVGRPRKSLENKVLPEKESSQTATPELELVEQSKKNEDESNKDSQMVTSSPQTDKESQELKHVEQTKNEKVDSQTISSSTTNGESQDKTNTTSQLVNDSEEMVKDQNQTVEGTDVNLSQEDSQVITPSSSDSQSLRRRRSKASSEAAELSQDLSNSSRRQSRSNSQTMESAVSQAEPKSGGRTRRSKVQEEQSKSSPENSQSLDISGSSQSSQGRGRYSRRKSSPALAANMQSSESESLEAKETPSMPKKRGRKSRALSLASPLTIEPKDKIDGNIAKDDLDISQKVDSQGIETTNVTDLDSPKSQDLQDSESLQVTCSIEEQSNEGGQMEVEAGIAVPSEPVVLDKTDTENTKDSSMSPCKKAETNADFTSQESDIGDSQPAEMLESVGISTEPIQEDLPCGTYDLSAVDIPAETTEEPPASASSKEKVAEVADPDDAVTENETCDLSAVDIPAETTEEPLASASSQEKVAEVADPDDAVTENETCDLSAVDIPAETTEEPQASASSKEKMAEPDDTVIENEKDLDEDHQEHPVEDTPRTSSGQNPEEYPDVIDEPSMEEEQPAPVEEDKSTNQLTEASAGEDVTPLQDSSDDNKTQILECQDGEKTQTSNSENEGVATSDAALNDVFATSVTLEPTTKHVFQESPMKQKDLEALMEPDVGQSPISGRTRGTWSPSASPSTSILKKGQKRPLEEETPSPLIKSRRVSFADPIQQQETADDIDRRSPAIRTSSPRRSRISNIPQPKYITTPTKGLLMLSPRNLHSPGYKSSKKCLISEMSQEPRPVSKDCIYPALVGCSAPVEAVLPQISSNMWSRGFGQLVRARNIKTVGDLSALTPGEIKTLPIRSPKISNVKKALKSYEQQRKGRGLEELKSFDETEMMTSELEETSTPHNQDEEDKTSGETLATELVDEPIPVDGRMEENRSGNLKLDLLAAGERPKGLLSEVEALTCRMSPLELNRCSPQQLVQMHDQLGGMMRRVVVELQTRVCQTDSKP
ncbi:telomere-associated protein RIF1 [Scomber scombrus]|uniref:Telomere-associated protein RIF1 n=1 Tax=Scomber scombrus TaxID=13677 RepID=A0AAV1PAH9_SCOSC